MQRINLSWFHQLLSGIQDVKQTVNVDDLDYLMSAWNLKPYIDAAIDNSSVPLTLKASKPHLIALYIAINELTSSDDQIEHVRTNKYKIAGLATKLAPVLEAELSVLPVYHVYSKRGYDTDVLAGDASRIFSDTVKSNFTENELNDISEAGKCLAFEIPTGAAFHLFRATESVITRYYEVVVGSLPKPKARNWSVYIRNLKECGASDKVTGILEHIKGFYRNPVIHPETTLRIDEALSLLGVIESAISIMVSEIIRLQYEAMFLPAPETPSIEAS